MNSDLVSQTMRELVIIGVTLQGCQKSGFSGFLYFFCRHFLLNGLQVYLFLHSYVENCL